MGLLTRLSGLLRGKSVEGQYRDGPYLLGGGWLPAGAPINWWQTGMSPVGGGTSAMVEACVSRYAQTVAMCPGDHWRRLDNGGRERVIPGNSALARIIRHPNEYQSISDFLLNLTTWLYEEGNAYALAIRNDRNEIAELHLMNSRQCHAQVVETGAIFYTLGGNEIVDRQHGSKLIPARDVLHVRLKTKRHPLKGESPLLCAALDVAAGNAALQQQLMFFANASRPSFILTTPEKWTKEEAAQARTAWEAQSAGINAGKTPIMGWGVTATQVSGTARDAQLAETMKMSNEAIALAYGIPLQVFGLGGGVPMGSTEALMSSWLASGLGFALNHIEEAFGQTFRLRGFPEEYLELNTSALLRSAHKDRIEALARGVQGGIYSPDEARAFEDLPSVPGGFGNEPRVQQQVVPLSWEPEPKAAPQLPPPAEPAEDEDADERYLPEAIARRLREYSGPVQ